MFKIQNSNIASGMTMAAAAFEINCKGFVRGPE
jgi:hypothetical protein